MPYSQKMDASSKSRQRKNTADIAGLLFLSPQTIYNCRSVTKNKAINKDTFEGDVLKLCTVIGLKL